MKFRLFLLLQLFLLTNVLISQNWDINTLRKVNLERNQKLDNFQLLVTNSDAPISILAPASVYTIGLIKKDSSLKNKGVLITSSLMVSSIITITMKYGINRDRPFTKYMDIEKLAPAGSPSFPSGHTSMAFSTATSMSISFPKWYVIIPSYIWASSVGYSRMHLGVHYPSDVLIGALIGSGSAWLSSIINKKINN